MRRMLPSHECSKAGDVPGLQVDNRLVVDAKLVLVERRAEIGFQLRPSDGSSVHCRVK